MIMAHVFVYVYTKMAKCRVCNFSSSLTPRGGEWVIDLLLELQCAFEIFFCFFTLQGETVTQTTKYHSYSLLFDELESL